MMDPSDRTILIVDDEPNLLNSLAFILEENGYKVIKAETGEKGVELAISHEPRLIVLDIDLPGMDGFEVAEELRTLRRRGTRIVMLTGSDMEEDIVRALKDLADDYIVKPLRPRVFLARIELILGRPSKCEIVVGHLTIDPDSFEARYHGKPLNLTPTEFNLLHLLATKPGKAFFRSDIIHAIHGKDCHLTDRSIDFQIHGLRRKLNDGDSMIITVRGVGFMLRAK